MTGADDEKYLDSLVARDLSGVRSGFDAEDIAYIRKNPELLRKLTNPLEVKKRYIYVLFSIAVSLGTVSKIFEYTEVFAANRALEDFMTNVLFSISVELFGAAAVAFLMELVFERRVQQNRRLIEQLAAADAQADG